MWHKHWTETIYVGQWPIFHGPVLLYILKTIWWTYAIIGKMDSCDAKIYLIKCKWVSDLHFKVQWFCLISRRLLEGLMLHWRYSFSMTQALNWNYTCRSMTYISWSSDFASHLEDLLIGQMSKSEYWIHMMQRFTRDNVCGSVTYISCSSDFVLYLEDYLMD